MKGILRSVCKISGGLALAVLGCVTALFFWVQLRRPPLEPYYRTRGQLEVLMSHFAAGVPVRRPAPPFCTIEEALDSMLARDPIELGEALGCWFDPTVWLAINPDPEVWVCPSAHSDAVAFYIPLTVTTPARHRVELGRTVRGDIVEMTRPPPWRPLDLSKYQEAYWLAKAKGTTRQAGSGPSGSVPMPPNYYLPGGLIWAG
jgi:hypothetical protein